MRVIKIFLLFVCCISLDVQSQTFLSDTLGINEDGSVIIAKSLALPGWILGVDVDSTDNLLFIRYRNSVSYTHLDVYKRQVSNTN